MYLPPRFQSPGKFLLGIIATFAGLLLIASVGAQEVSNRVVEENATTSPRETLLDIYLLAQKNNAELREAQAQYQSVQQGSNIAVSDLLPQLNYEYQLSEVRQNLEGGIYNITGGSDRYTTRFDRLALSQALFRRDLWLELERADVNTARALAQRDAVRQQLIVQTAQAYFAVLAAQDLSVFSDKEKQAIESQLKQANIRYRVGLADLIEVKETQASYDLAVAREIEAQNHEDNQREALSVITGHFHEQLASLSDRLRPKSPDPQDIQQWAAAALENNLGYLIYQQELKMADHVVDIERAQHWPSLNLVANLDDSESTGGVFSGGGQARTKTDTFGVQLTVPLFLGGKTYFRTEQAAFARAAAEARLLGARRDTEQLARSAYRNVTAGITQIAALERALESAEIDLQANQAGLKAGTRDTVDVVEATSRLYAAKRDLHQARYDYLVATLQLRQAAGQLGVEDIEWINRLLD